MFTSTASKIALIAAISASSVIAAPQAAATTATPVTTYKACPDPLYPSCESLPLPATNYWNENFKVPEPPVIADWVKWVRERENPIYPIDIKPVSPNGTFWGASSPASNKRGLTWIDPENLATELCGCTDGKWAFTFDDGPRDLTRDFLALLDRYNIKATFFVVGSNVVASSVYRQNLKAAYDAGHQIALHSWTHAHSTSQSTDVLISEVIYSAKAVFETIGKVPRYYRNPYADLDDRTRNLMVAFGLRTALWNADSSDTGAVFSVNDAIKTRPDGTPFYDQTLWTAVNVTQRFREIATVGFQPLVPGGATGVTWVPQAPAAVRAGAPAEGPYVGFISLQHETIKTQLEIAEAIIPLILNGTEPNFNLPQPATTLPATTTRVSTETASATTTAAPVQTARTFIPATVAECDGDDRRRYFDESEPFAKFIAGIKLPLHPIPTQPSSGAAHGLVVSGSWVAGAVAAVMGAFVAGLWA